MDKLNTLISLNDAKKSIDELIVKLRKGDDKEGSCDSTKLLIIALSIVGSLVIIGVVAFAVYKHFSKDEYDEFDDLFDDEEDDSDDDEDDDVEEEEETSETDAE